MSSYIKDTSDKINENNNKSCWRLKRLRAEPSLQSSVVISLVKIYIWIFFFKGNFALRVGTFHSRLTPYLIQWPQVFCKWRYDRFILCHATSQGLFIEGSCKRLGGSSLQYVTTYLSMFVAIGRVQVEIWNVMWLHQTTW